MRSDAVELVIADGVTCVTVRGEFGLTLAERFVVAALSGSGDVDVDLAEVTFMDSAGLGALAQVIHAMAGEGHRVKVTAASPLVERLIGICGMADLLGLDADASLR